MLQRTAFKSRGKAILPMMTFSSLMTNHAYNISRSTYSRLQKPLFMTGYAILMKLLWQHWLHWDAKLLKTHIYICCNGFFTGFFNYDWRIHVKRKFTKIFRVGTHDRYQWQATMLGRWLTITSGTMVTASILASSMWILQHKSAHLGHLRGSSPTYSRIKINHWGQAAVCGKCTHVCMRRMLRHNDHCIVD